MNAVSAQNIWLEPECGSVGENWVIGEDAEASGGNYISYSSGTSLSEPPLQGEDQVRIQFTVVQAGNYKVWARVKAGAGLGDSFWFQLDNEGWIKWKGINKNNQYNWERVLNANNGDESVTINLTAGEHIFTVSYREANVQLDKLFFSIQNTIPSGIGELSANCEDASSIWLEAECAQIGANLQNIDQAQASQNQAILMQGDEQLDAPSNDPNNRIILEIEAEESGEYNLFGRLSAENEEANSLWLKVNNEAWIPWDNIGNNGTEVETETDPQNTPTDLPIIPNYSSFAMSSKGGRGGKIMKVTNLKDSGTGSLRACVEASGPRVCVFETSGVIRLTDELKISNPYITIAGQTAPDPGVILYGQMFVIRSHDVLMQHIGIRPGDINYGSNPEKGTKDCISIRRGSNNIVIDHVSLGWGSDESMDISGNVGEVALRNVMISNALNAKGHAFGALFYDQGSLSIEGSMFANLDQRQPMSRIGKLIHVNNLHYNRGLRFAQFSTNANVDNKTLNSLVGNVYVEGPNRRSNVKPLLLHRGDMGPGTKMYLKDNYWKSNVNSSGSLGNQWSLIEDQGGNADIKADKPPVWVNGVRVLTEENQIIDYVLSSVGSRPARRNYLDQKVIDDYKAGRGKIVDCVSGCTNNDGGTPKLATNTRKLNIPSNPNGDDDGDGYTNLEEWLHQMAADVEGKPYEPGDAPTGGDQPGLASGFSWHKLTNANQQDLPVTLNLQAGRNTIEIARREEGVILDKLFLTKTTSSPSSLGGNAYNCGSAPELFTSLYLNAGGSTYNASEGKIFMEDEYFSLPSTTQAFNLGISETADEGLYKTQRKGDSFQYEIPVENGKYDIRLRFAELSHQESGRRRFNVLVEGGIVLDNLDLFAEAGFGAAVDQEILQVSVEDERLSLEFMATIGEAQICAIEVLPAGSLGSSNNTPPSFTTSGDLLLAKNFEGIQKVNVFPDPVSEEEASQVVSYSLSPAFSLISNISINPNTGEVKVVALEGLTGVEEFTITADDGQEKNNTFSRSFQLIIVSGEPTPVNGGSTLRINVGGQSYTTTTGLEFEADKYSSGNSNPYTVTNEIGGTQDDLLYQTGRSGYEFSYQIPVINGEYNVVLHFSETYWTEAGRRVFDISVENEAYLPSYDIFESFGGNTVAVEVISEIQVTDGLLNLEFLSRRNFAKLSAIEVLTTYNPGLTSIDSRRSMRINGGESREKAFGGYVFQPDLRFMRANTNSLTNENIGISQTDYDELYHSSRSSQISGESMGYDIPLENGPYVVYLHFAELYWGVSGGAIGGSGSRVFSISMEDQVIEPSFDILAKTEPGTAYVIRAELNMNDGIMNLDLGGIVDKPFISAIEIMLPEEEELSLGRDIYLSQQGLSPEIDPFTNTTLYPNPSNTNTRLMINSEIDGDFNLTIMDIKGKELMRLYLRKTGPIAKYILPTEELVPGMYIVRLISDSGSRSMKLLIQE